QSLLRIRPEGAVISLRLIFVAVLVSACSVAGPASSPPSAAGSQVASSSSEWQPDPGWPTPPPAPVPPPVDSSLAPVSASALSSDARAALEACDAFDPALGALTAVAGVAFVSDL